MQCVGPVTAHAAQVYGNHYAKVTCKVASTTLHKAGCDHLDAIAKHMVVVLVVEEALELLHHTRRRTSLAR